MSGKRSFSRFFTENAGVIIFLLLTAAAVQPSGLSITAGSENSADSVRVFRSALMS